MNRRKENRTQERSPFESAAINQCSWPMYFSRFKTTHSLGNVHSKVSSHDDVAATEQGESWSLWNGR